MQDEQIRQGSRVRVSLGGKRGSQKGSLSTSDASAANALPDPVSAADAHALLSSLFRLRRRLPVSSRDAAAALA